MIQHNGENTKLISKDQMFGPILLVSPTFQNSWDEFCEDWAGHPAGPQYYMALSDLARHLIGLIGSKDKDLVRKILEIVETWLLDGDHYVREATTIGLLEALQNDKIHTTTTPKDFLPYLLPETQYWWTKVELFWAEGVLIVDDPGLFTEGQKVVANHMGI